MTNRIVINRLLAAAGGSETVTLLDLQPGLNVVSGPSDSGKSYVVDLLDFMFGASELHRVIPEIEGYRYIILQLSTVGEDSRQLSIARKTGGGPFEMRNGHTAEVGNLGDPVILAQNHSPKNLENLSNYLLDVIGLAGSVIQTNKNNKTRSLSFRDLAHLAIVDETSMQSERSPVTPSGQWTRRTAERSVFGLLLDGQDDSDLTEVAPSADERKLSDTRSQLLDRVVAVLEGNMRSPTSINETRDQLHRLSTAIDVETGSIEQILERRDVLASERTEATEAVQRVKTELSELSDLYNRFQLLSAQYQSDLDRLEMISEAGTLLTLSNSGVCILCGASPEHQDWSSHQSSELNSLSDAVDAERDKTERLAGDLALTLTDIRQRAHIIRTELEESSRRVESISSELRSLDSLVRPARAQLRELVDKRSSLERSLTLYEQIESVDALRARVEASEPDATPAREKPSSEALYEFANTMRDALQAWGVQGASSVRYDRTSLDLVVGGRTRASRGKGVRALQHAAFSVALARYCTDRDLPTIGFLVLDSPLVTYREPDPDDEAYEPGAAQMMTTEALYLDLSTRRDIQTIVLENVSPPFEDSEKLHHIAFSRNVNVGRFGLFPADS